MRGLLIVAIAAALCGCGDEGITPAVIEASASTVSPDVILRLSPVDLATPDGVGAEMQRPKAALHEIVSHLDKAGDAWTAVRVEWHFESATSRGYASLTYDPGTHALTLDTPALKARATGVSRDALKGVDERAGTLEFNLFEPYGCLVEVSAP